MLDSLISFYRRHMPQQVRSMTATLLGYHSPFAKDRSTVRVRDFIEYYTTLAGTDGSCPVIQDRDAALHALHRQFKQRGIRSEVLGGIWWEQFAQAITLNDHDGLELQSNLRAGVNEVPADLLLWWEWLSIYNLLLKFGLFNVAYGLRVKARESILTELKSGKIKLGTYAHLKAFGALVELRHWELLKTEINKIKPWHSEDKYFLELLYAMACDHEHLKKMKNVNNQSVKDRQFYEFNTNKTIAYVGPAKTENRDGAEIDAFDVVVRANHKNTPNNDNSLSKGLRANISYYNGVQSRRLAEQGEVLPDGIRFAIAVQTNFQYLKKLPKSKTSKNSCPAELRTPRNYRSLLMQGSFHAMPNAIMDILKCYPKEIKIFHADLMLTVSRFEGYKAHAGKVAEHAKVFLGTVTNHDPIVQWSFLEIPYKAGLLKGDSMFNRVMEMGEEKYMQALQEVYGNFARLVSSPILVTE